MVILLTPRQHPPPRENADGVANRASTGEVRASCPFPGGQYLSIRYFERLGEEKIVASVGSKSDSYDPLAESFNGLYKTELILRQGPWRNVEHVEWETLKYVDWFNNRRIHEALDWVSPAEFEAHYCPLRESESLPALEMI